MSMKPEGRAKILLRAAYDMLKKCDDAGYVISPMETTVFYDDADCDGTCLMVSDGGHSSCSGAGQRHPSAKKKAQMTTITNDWEQLKATLLVDGVDYDVVAYVYLTLKRVPSEYDWPTNDLQVADYSLEGFDCLPPMRAEHEKEIERQLAVRLEELYGQ